MIYPALIWSFTKIRQLEVVDQEIVSRYAAEKAEVKEVMEVI